MWFVNVLLPIHFVNMIFPYLFESPFLGETSFFFAKAFFELTHILFNTNEIRYLIPPYIGIIGLIFFCFSWRMKGWARFYQVSVVVIFAYMMTFPLLVPLHRAAPILSQLPRIERLNTELVFSLAVLAGLGAHRILHQEVVMKWIPRFFMGLCAFIVGSLLSLRIIAYFQEGNIREIFANYIEKNMVGSDQYLAPLEFYLNRIDEFFIFINQWTNVLSPSIVMPVAFIAISLLLISLWQRRKISKLFFSLGFVALLCVDIFSYVRVTHYGGSTPEDVQSTSGLVQFLKADREIFRIISVLSDAEFGVGRMRHIMAPNTNMIYGVSTVEGYDALFPKRYSAFFRNFQNDYEKDPAMILAGSEGQFNHETMRYLNVKYFLAAKDVTLAMNLPVVYEDDQQRLYLNENYYPRAFMVHDYVVRQDDLEILDYLKSEQMEFDEMVVLEEAPSFDPSGAEVVSLRSHVAIEKYDAHSIKLRIYSSAPGLLVLTDTYFPGWRATLNLSPVKILRANYTFRAIEIPSGTHEVEFKYRPASFQWGVLTSLLFFIMGCAWVLFLIKKKASIPREINV